MIAPGNITKIGRIIGRSAEFCLSRTDLPTLDAAEATQPARGEEDQDCGELVSSEAARLCRPDNGMLEEELGRTGEYYAISKK